jgi:2-dehydro-3-deoxy-D-gluconate 5-dehydrogenase
VTMAADLFSLAGRKAVVTGASRGLGQAMAVALGGAGADVVCVSTAQSGTDETARQIRALGRHAWQLECDLSNREATVALPAQCREQAGEVDILVNNAGTIRRHPAADFPMEDWDLVLRTNLDAVFLLCQAFGKRMIERRNGKIINVASLLSFSGGVTVPAYTASKHAVAGLTKALANEWGKHGVQINAIAPGYFKTDNTTALQQDQTRSAEISGRIPAARWGDAADLSGPVVFLASTASDYVNGHVLVVDGGWMAR